MDDTVDLLKIKIEKAKRDLSPETVNAINAIDWKAAILSLRAKKGYTFEQLGDLELETELLLAGLTNPENYPAELSKRMKISGEAANELADEMNDLVFKKIRGELIKNSERRKGFVHTAIPGTSTPEMKKIPEGAGISRVNITPISMVPKETKSSLSKDGIDIIDKPVLPTETVKLPSEVPPVVIRKERENILEKIEKPELIPGSFVLPPQTGVVKSREEVHPLLAQKLATPVQIPTVQTDHSLGNITKTSTPSGIPIKPGTVPSTTPEKPKVDPYREVPE